MKQSNRVQWNLSIEEAERVIDALDRYASSTTRISQYKLQELVNARRRRNVFISKTTREPEVQTEQKERGTPTKVQR